MYKLVFYLGLSSLLLTTLWGSGQAELPTVTTEVYHPVSLGTDLSHYDDQAFQIAELLEERGLSDSAVELLDISQLILDKSQEISVPPSLILAMIHVESTFNPCAISRVGARGLMQVMPYRILGRDQAHEIFAFNYHQIYDPTWNITFGADYLGYLIRRFGSVETALIAYNAGPTRVSAWLKDDAPIKSGYMRRVLHNNKRFGNKIGADAQLL